MRLTVTTRFVSFSRSVAGVPMMPLRADAASQGIQRAPGIRWAGTADTGGTIAARKDAADPSAEPPD